LKILAKPLARFKRRRVDWRQGTQTITRPGPKWLKSTRLRML
jgi:hypothetical protein